MENLKCRRRNVGQERARMLEIDPADFSALDEHFGLLMTRLGGSESIGAAARLLSAGRALGHTCIPFASFPLPPHGLLEEFRSSPVIGEPGAARPMILDSQNRLYLQRYWAYEQSLAASIRGRLAAPPIEIDHSWLDASIDRLLPLAAGKTEDQRSAVSAAMQSRFCVITGGPGTGKTRTVAVLLTLLFEHASRTGARPPRVALAAPTGK